MWRQREFELLAKPQGYHLVTDEVIRSLPDLEQVTVGVVQLFLLHTSAALSLNENADADVRADMQTMMDRVVPEGQPIRHTLEGPDDMPAHVKSSLIGVSLHIPIASGRLRLGTWQGIYLCEFRRRAGKRRVVATIWGEDSDDAMPY